MTARAGPTAALAREEMGDEALRDVRVGAGLVGGPETSLDQFAGITVIVSASWTSRATLSSSSWIT